jgi:hypothetical protein
MGVMVGYAVVVLGWLALAIAFVALINSIRLFVRDPRIRNRGAVVSFALFWAALGVGVLLSTYVGTLA